MRIFDIIVDSKDLISDLVEMDYKGFIIVNHGAQPANLFIILLNFGRGIQFSIEMEPIAPREERGRIKISRPRIDVQAPFEKNQHWKKYETDAPEWINHQRKVEVLRAFGDNYAVDTGIRIRGAKGELALRASSFPACLEVGLSDLDFEIDDEDAEFPRHELTARDLRQHGV